MRTWDTCGNDIDDTVSTCPFCESPQSAGARPTTGRRPVKTVKLKQGMPSVDEALSRLERELGSARAGGVRMVRVIHGYGSSGVGGDIKTSVRARLVVWLQRGRIRAFTAGDDYTHTTRQGRALVARFPELKKSLTTDRNNPGITFVEV